MSVLVLDGVHKRFGDNHVLRGVDLAVASHEVVVVIGASGSGKSTLMRTINLIERVDDGRVGVWSERLDSAGGCHEPRVGGARRVVAR